MKRTLTALALVMTAGTASAQMTETDMVERTSADLANEMGNLIRSRDITGGEIYSVSMDDATWDMDLGYDDYARDWDQIGEIEDIILDRAGQMVGIVGEIGGFLDLGDKHVLLATPDVRLVPVDDTSYVYVTRLSEEQLEELPSVDEGFWN
ncbi:MAG: PRC-barrel domain-containing protein [Shimia sp.]